MTPDLNSYDYIVVAFSGGKDSTACVLHLLEAGADPAKIELWHHLIDGREGSTLMDWPVTEDYCRKFAEAFGFPIYFSWKEGGFEREMLRDKSLTAPNHFEKPAERNLFNDDDNLIECGIVGGTRGKHGTRRKFPQVSADLSVRWCSAYLKIDVCTAALNNDPRFRNKRTLVVTGERAEESSARAKYKVFEPDRADRRDGKRVKRHVDHWRPVHAWKEAEVWDIIKRHKVMPHPAYRLGWGRLSCMSCIFGSASMWASLDTIAPDHVKRIAEYEKEFGVTIHRTDDIWKRVDLGEVFPDMNPEVISEGLGTECTSPMITDDWEMPAGAFGENAGPS